jgi:hypothetical protein
VAYETVVKEKWDGTSTFGNRLKETYRFLVVLLLVVLGLDAFEV